MKSILYINGSPRGEKNSTSAQILRDVADFLEKEGVRETHLEMLTLSRNMEGNADGILKRMNSAEYWILALPLYVDALPGHLTWWLKQYEGYRERSSDRGSIKVYGIINCGFPEAVQNRDALKILEIFCRKNGLDWRFGIGMGMGEPYKQMRDIPLRSFIKVPIFKAYKLLLEDIKGERRKPDDNLYISIRFPRFLYRFIGEWGWKSEAKKNGLKARDLYGRPLL